ncbi:MAG: hypothetical protein LE169_04355 [Endomicrobium sp.]|nr:hypothetical protein [Endomicrobium sp.]
MRKTLSLVLLLFLLIGCGKNALLPVKQEAKQEEKKEKKEQKLEPAKESKEQDPVLIEYVYPSRWTLGRIMITAVAVVEAASVLFITYHVRDRVCNFDFDENTVEKIIMYILYGLTFFTGLGAVLR